MKYISSILIGFMLGMASCKDNNAPNLDHIKINVNAQDFCKDFSKLDTINLVNELSKLQSKYPDYYSFFIDTLAFGTVAVEEGNTNLDGIKYFLSHKDYRSLMDTVNIAFPSTEQITEDLTTTFKLIKNYDTSFDVPEHIYYAVTGLSNMVVLGSKNDITISLDFYLGENFKPYYQIGIPDFLSKRFVAPYIPINAAQTIFLDKYPFEAFGQDLLSMMIEQGKQQYFLSLVTPKAQDNMRLGFTNEQMKWCLENEREIYNFFASKDMLFSKDVHKVVRYVQDGPVASGMPPESPANVGSFIGYQIIKAYVDQTGANLVELLAEKDSNKILQLAKYKP